MVVNKNTLHPDKIKISYVFWEAKSVYLVKQRIFVISSQEPVQRDYSLCSPLHGPPRIRDRIAYKVSNIGDINHFLIQKNQKIHQNAPVGMECLLNGDCETNW